MNDIVKIYIHRTSNPIVTSLCFDIIEQAGVNSNSMVINTTSMCRLLRGNKRDIYFVSDCMDALILKILGCRHIVMWFQGVVPEESYMRHANKFRFKILSILEKSALQNADYNMFVSKAMVRHFESKYHVILNNKTYILPCFNTLLSENSFKVCEKYINNTFVYAGGTAVWQCFNKMLSLYKQIESLGIPNTKLIILTKDQSYAEQQIKAVGICNYSIDYVSRDNLPDVLSSAKFGFVLRTPSIVNNVSTPTKISTYLSCGVIPIYGDCIDSFHEYAQRMRFAISWNQNEEEKTIERIRDLMQMQINYEDILLEYRWIFQSYYSSINHTNNISDIIKSIKANYERNN